MRKNSTATKGERTAVAKRAVKKRRVERLPLPVERAAYTLTEFCRAHRLSRSLYYEIKKRGDGPIESRFGTHRKIIISIENAEKWRVEHGGAHG